jgi:hypothetical protein
MVYLTLGINVQRNLVCLSATVVRTLTVTAFAIAMTCAVTSLARPSSTVVQTATVTAFTTASTSVVKSLVRPRTGGVRREKEEMTGVVITEEEMVMKEAQTQRTKSDQLGSVPRHRPDKMLSRAPCLGT